MYNLLGFERLKFAKIAYKFDPSKPPIFSGIERVKTDKKLKTHSNL